MIDLISRSALLEFAHNHVNCTVDCNDIARFPGVDAEPVQHGKWIKGMLPTYGGWKCSLCNRSMQLLTKPNYCPNCGARMDGDKHAAD